MEAPEEGTGATRTWPRSRITGSQVGEPELQLALGRLRRVRAVDQVVLGLQREVAADGARGGLLDRVGAAGQLAERGDGARALDGERDQRARGDELQQVAEERTLLVLGVVLLGQRLRNGPQLDRGELEALALDPRDDFADEAARDAIGLDQDQRAFSHDGISP